SAAHQKGLTFAIAGHGQVACDLEAVRDRPPSAWLDLLGENQLSLASRIGEIHSEGLSPAATRVWTALECLRKAGLPADAPLTLEASADDGWVVLKSGTLLITSCIMPIAGSTNSLAFAIALQPTQASAVSESGGDTFAPFTRKSLHSGADSRPN